jgi:hypothetical protein
MRVKRVSGTAHTNFANKGVYKKKVAAAPVEYA